MSASSSTRSWWRRAKPPAVTALGAMMMTKQEVAMEISARISRQLTEGSARLASPPGTEPRAATASVGRCVSGRCSATCPSCSIVCGEVTAMPSISPSMAMPTWNPTPVRNPASTVRDRKSARKPSLKMRARSSSPAVRRATTSTRAM
jgi:hypothetical protein